MLVLDILVIVGFLIFGAYKLIKKDAGLFGGLFVYLFLIPMTLYGIAQLTLACDNIAIEARVTVAVICMILLVAYFIYGFYEAYRKPTEEEIQKEKEKQKENYQREREESRKKAHDFLAEHGYDFSEEIMDLVMAPGTPVMGGFTQYNTAGFGHYTTEEVIYWLWDNCYKSLAYLPPKEFDEKLGCDVEKITPCEMRPGHWRDMLNRQYALTAGYLAKKGIPMKHYNQQKKFLECYPYCRKDFLAAFGLPSPLDDSGDEWYVNTYKSMHESPLKRTLGNRGRFYWNFTTGFSVVDKL